MPLVPFNELMEDAERRSYAVGYFESWGLESLLAVADAAEATRSPVILGFSGIYLPHEKRRFSDPLSIYAAMASEIASYLSVPCCLLFNESPHLVWAEQAIELGFQLVMYTPSDGDMHDQIERIRSLVDQAHARGIAVEAELSPLPGVAGDLAIVTNPKRERGDRELDVRLAEDSAVRVPNPKRERRHRASDVGLVRHPAAEQCLTDPASARAFVNETGVDALAVNVGQIHLHGRHRVRLNLDRLRELKRTVRVPLVLHGASSVETNDLREAISLGVRKINVGSVLKQAFFGALRSACVATSESANPYEVLGSGLEQDVLVAGRAAMKTKVEELMHLFGSVGKAGKGR